MQPRSSSQRQALRLDDEAKFIGSWFRMPLVTGAVAPSGKALAKAMAHYVDPARPGPVIELGPGTGAVTQAIVERGIDPARLVLVEFNPDFCRLMRERYPTATVVQGDAYSLAAMLPGLLGEPASAIVSGLPLFNRPLRNRIALLDECLALMRAGAPFVQFTYALIAPIPHRSGRYYATERSRRIWRNMPPATVWVYRKTHQA